MKDFVSHVFLAKLNANIFVDIEACTLFNESITAHDNAYVNAHFPP
jgi:hypothetical protein